MLNLPRLRVLGRYHFIQVEIRRWKELNDKSFDQLNTFFPKITYLLFVGKHWEVGGVDYQKLLT